MSKLPPTYEQQSGCRDCRHVFFRTDFGGEQNWYCTLDAPPRPRCGSVAMDEWSLDPPMDWQAWQDWKEGREVHPWGTCEQWEGK